MLTPGLASVTFRKLDVAEIIRLATRNGLLAIEWGGDVHVPHGDLRAARETRKQTRDAGLQIAAYGSYYSAGAGAGDMQQFQPILATAVELGAPIIRVWAGKSGSETTSASGRSLVADDLRRICALAESANVKIALEFHQGTLTDSDESTLLLMHEVAHHNLHAFWQPRHGEDTERAAQSLARIQPYLLNVHVFHWWPTAALRHPLSTGADRWRRFASILKADSRPHVMEIEFVLDDDPDAFAADASVLRDIINDQKAP